MDNKRVVAATRKVSLSEFADDWDDCYAVVRLASYGEYVEVANKDFTDIKQEDALKFEYDFVISHFVSGKILLLGSDELQDMAVDDIDAVPGMTDYLYRVSMGMTLDPKVSGKAAQDMSEPSSSENTTKTT